MEPNKTTATKPAGFPKTDPSRAFSDMAEKGASQTKEAFEKMGAATSEAADLIKASCSTALESVHEYNSKIMEFAQANTKAGSDFIQKLYAVKSPAEFMTLSAEHVRTQTETLNEQAKQLAELVQKIALAAAEPLKTGLARAFNQAA
jgi:phasin